MRPKSVIYGKIDELHAEAERLMGQINESGDLSRVINLEKEMSEKIGMIKGLRFALNEE